MQCPNCQRELNQKECAERMEDGYQRKFSNGKKYKYQFGRCVCNQRLIFITEDDETTVEAI